MAGILQDRLPLAPWMAAHTLRLPGTRPIAPADWLQRDEAFAAQMAYRDRLVAECPDAVHAVMAGAEPAAAELLALVLDHVAGAPGYAAEAGGMRRPDGLLVPLDGPPLLVAGRLVQEDLCLMQKPDGADEHALTAAVLCFPSNWTLSQKIGLPLTRIHVPVEVYDAGVARRVQRLFDLVRPDAPLMRANLIPYDNSELHNPRPEFPRHHPEVARFVRVERQTILRLPATGAAVFSIHVYQVPLGAIVGEERARLAEVRPGWFG